MCRRNNMYIPSYSLNMGGLALADEASSIMFDWTGIYVLMRDEKISTIAVRPLARNMIRGKQ